MKDRPVGPPQPPREWGDNDAADPEQNLEEKDSI